MKYEDVPARRTAGCEPVQVADQREVTTLRGKIKDMESRIQDLEEVMARVRSRVSDLNEWAGESGRFFGWGK